MKSLNETTMKQITFILFFLFYCAVHGQEWSLENIDKSKKIKYEYWFQFNNAEDTSSFYFVKSTNNSNSIIRLTDNENSIVFSALIRVKGLNNDTVINILSDFDGLGTIKLNAGKYQVEASTLGYDKAIFEFEILEGENFDLTIKLGLASELTVYQINSKKRLTDEEIHIIMSCVKTNKGEFYRKCSKKGIYYVSMQL